MQLYQLKKYHFTHRRHHMSTTNVLKKKIITLNGVKNLCMQARNTLTNLCWKMARPNKLGPTYNSSSSRKTNLILVDSEE